MAAFTPIIEANRKDEIVLKKIICIHYLLCFCKDKKNEMRALINSGSKINAIIPAYTLELDFKVRQTHVEAQKIDNSTLKTFNIVLASF